MRAVVVALLVGAFLAGPSGAGRLEAQTPPPTYVEFEPFGVKGALYRPDSSRERNIGVLLIHRVNNYLGHLAAWQLAERGFVVLAMNSRFDNNEASVVWEVIAQDVRTGVEYLRKQRGIRKVILFGHSGGAATLSFYQAVAEQGPAYCTDPQRLTRCGTELASLPKADGLILVDASPGNPIGLLRGLNPAVKTEGDPASIDPALDPFNPANGFSPAGSTYSDEFKKKYYAAQSARMNRLIGMAIEQATKLGTPAAPFPDDNAFLIVRASGARLIDSAESTATTEPRKLLKNNGAVVTEIVKSSRPPATAAPQQNATFNGGARLLTLRSFLTANAIKSTNSLTGIDWCSSNSSTPCAVGKINVPLLVAAMGGNTGIRDNEMLYDMAVSKDKDFIVVEGATHNIEPCTDCETRKGEYGNVTKNFFNYVAKWITTRF
jgi:pimeloyl-ACP methyl ester carboxylesterase